MNRLKKILNSLTIEEKIGQTVQVNGKMFMEEGGAVDTGPIKDLGFKEDFDPYKIGSLLNITKPEEIRQIQKKYLDNSTHKIPLLFMADVIYGYRTIYPIPLAQAGSFDFDLIESCSREIAKETYNSGIHVAFSPMLDLVRDPRWGRVMESPGEDVYLGCKYGESVVRGYQGEFTKEGKIKENQVAACIKHFAAYGASEGGREYNTVDMSELKFRQIYLPSYQAALKAKAKLVMTAFNLLNGVPSTANKWLNRDVLRKENNFDGILISDFAAVEELILHGYAKDKKDATKKSLTAGVDIDMMTSCYANEIKALIESGELEESLLDEAVMRILKLKDDLGLFENPYRGLKKEEVGKVLSDSAKEKAVKLVEKSTVLLKNEDLVLPIEKTKKIALIGPYGTSKLTLGFWASVTGSPLDTKTLYDGLLENYNEENIFMAKGYNLFDSYEPFGQFKNAIAALSGKIEDEKALIKEAVNHAEKSDVIILTFGEHFFESGEGASKVNLRIAKKQINLLKALKELNKPIVGILYTGRPLILTDIEKYFDSILLAWFPGTMGGIGLSNLISGKANPSGRLSMSFPRAEGQIPVYYSNYQTGRPVLTSNHSERFVSKYIDEKNIPLYSFGYGLSYSSFDYKLEGLDKRNIKRGECQSIDVVITNTSDIAGEEVVQLYCYDKVANFVRPTKELKAAKRILLLPGEEKKVSFEITDELMSYIGDAGQVLLENGEFQWFIGDSSENIKITVIIELID